MPFWKRGVSPWLIMGFFGLWMGINLCTLNLWPNLLFTGDEAWLADASWNLVSRLRLANTMFPFTSLAQGYGPVSQWIFHGLEGWFLRAMGPGLTPARLASLASGFGALLILWFGLGKKLGPAALVLGLSPSFLMASHLARPEALGLVFLSLGALFLLRNQGVALGALGGLSFFASPAAGCLVSGFLVAHLFFGGSWKNRGLALLAYALALAGAGTVAGLVGGFHLLPPDVHRDYVPPILRGFNPLFLAKGVIKKTYWPYLLGFRDPTASILAPGALAWMALRRFRLGKDEVKLLLAGAAGVVIFGIAAPKTPPYYFVYIVFLVSVFAGISLRGTARALVFAVAGLAGLIKLGLDTASLPASDRPSRVAALVDLRDHRVMGPAPLWFALGPENYFSPLFAKYIATREEFFARMDSLDLDYIILPDPDTSGPLYEYARQKPLVREIPFRGYYRSRGRAVRIRRLLVYDLRR